MSDKSRARTQQPTQRIQQVRPPDTETRRFRLQKLEQILGLLDEEQIDEVLQTAERVLREG